jgi:outer membrane protein assembly factor BamB
MAQAGYTPIQLYHSTTAAAAPTAGNLLAGELAINTNDGKLYYEDSSGVVQVLATKAGASGDVVGPASATDGNLAAFDGTTGKLIKQAATVTVAQGGTGATTLTANNVILGNGTSAVQFVAPGASGNVLTSNGTTWQSTTPAATGASKGQAIAFAMIFGL